METTVISVYDDPARALSAKNELIASGFSSRNVQLNPDPDQATKKEAHESAVNASIGNFFRSFFFGVGDKSTLSHIYADAVRRGSSVLIVNTESDAQLARAKEIVGHHDPVDMEERSSHWIQQGWRGHNPEAPR